MKKWTMLVIGAALALLLAGCGCFFNESGAEADLVFVNCSDAQISSVVLHGDHFEQGTQNADNSPISRGDSFGFEVEGYPVTVVVCRDVDGGSPLVKCTIEEAPAEGERWYVAARDMGSGVMLEVSTQWPEDETQQAREVLQVLSGIFLPWAFLWVPLALLVGMALACLIRLSRDQRRGLLTATVVVGCAAAILFGGVWLLRGCGLSWRTVPLEVLCALTWLSGLTAGVLTVRYLPRLARQHAPRLVVWAQAAALYCLLSVMLVGSFVGLFWAAFTQNSGGETVGTYEGQRVVQVEMDSSIYTLFAYHGPLVRGTEALAWSEEPMVEVKNSQWVTKQGVKAAGRDLGVSLEDGSPLYYKDTHGWFGDGETFLTITFEETPEWLADWKELPLTGALVRVNESLANNCFPDIQQGWYFFKDRHSQSQDSTDDSQLFSRASWNFTLAVYDSQTDTLYYYVLDT